MDNEIAALWFDRIHRQLKRIADVLEEQFMTEVPEDYLPPTPPEVSFSVEETTPEPTELTPDQIRIRRMKEIAKTKGLPFYEHEGQLVVDQEVVREYQSKYEPNSYQESDSQ